jgi:UDP-N-acetylmuramoyl-tripeptide--D-alanyl-D-alanine ligase
LGKAAQTLHENVGSMALEKGVDHIFTLGALSKHAAGVFPSERANCFDDGDDLVKAVRAQIIAGALEGAVILIKGSRFMKMERVVSAMTEGGQSL